MANITVDIKGTREFRDLDLNFGIHPIRKDINKVTGERAIINSIKNLVLTNFYERPMHPEIGSGLQDLLFEPMDFMVAVSIENAIKTVLKNYEPRARVVEVAVKPRFDENRFDVEITFYIVNLPNPVTISFHLQRIR